MKAEEARKLTEQALSAKEGVIADMVSHALKRIEQAARAGSRSVYDPCGGLRTTATPIQVQAAHDHLGSLGYEVRRDTGNQHDPESTWEVSW